MAYDEPDSFLPTVEAYRPRSTGPPPDERPDLTPEESDDPVGETAAPASAPPGRRRTVLLVGAVVLALLVGGGVVVARALLRDDRLVVSFGDLPLDAAMTSRPTRDWSLSLPDAERVLWVQGLDDGSALVGWQTTDGGSQRVGRVGGAGRLAWSRETPRSVVLGFELDGVYVTQVADGDESGVEAFDVDDGAVLWSVKGTMAVPPRAGTVLVLREGEGGRDDYVQARDLRSGRQVWSTPADDVRLTGDAVYLRHVDDVERRGLRTGGLRWRVSGLDAPSYDAGTRAFGGDPVFAVSDSAVLVLTLKGVRVLSADDGKVLDRYPAEPAVHRVLPLGGRRFVVVRLTGNQDSSDPEGTVTIVDGGRVREKRDLGDAPLSMFVVHDGGDVLLTSPNGGPVLDDRLHVVGRLPTGPQVYAQPVAGGFYEQDGTTLTFRDRSGRGRWTFQVPTSATYVVGDGCLLVSEDDRLTRYD